MTVGDSISVSHSLLLHPILSVLRQSLSPLPSPLLCRTAGTLVVSASTQTHSSNTKSHFQPDNFWGTQWRVWRRQSNPFSLTLCKLFIFLTSSFLFAQKYFSMSTLDNRIWKATIPTKVKKSRS